jgi:hypothetical protein
MKAIFGDKGYNTLMHGFALWGKCLGVMDVPLPDYKNVITSLPFTWWCFWMFLSHDCFLPLYLSPQL